MDDVYSLNGSIGEEYSNGSYGSGVWLTVSKDRFIIVDLTPKIHVIINEYHGYEKWEEI